MSILCSEPYFLCYRLITIPVTTLLATQHSVLPCGTAYKMMFPDMQSQTFKLIFSINLMFNFFPYYFLYICQTAYLLSRKTSCFAHLQ